MTEHQSWQSLKYNIDYSRWEEPAEATIKARRRLGWHWQNFAEPPRFPLTLNSTKLSELFCGFDADLVTKAIPILELASNSTISLDVKRSSSSMYTSSWKKNIASANARHPRKLVGPKYIDSGSRTPKLEDESQKSGCEICCWEVAQWNQTWCVWLVEGHSHTPSRLPALEDPFDYFGLAERKRKRVLRKVASVQVFGETAVLLVQHFLLTIRAIL